MGFVTDLVDYNLWKGGDLWDSLKDDPERGFLGAMTPAGTELWNGILGKDWDTELSWTGGSTEKDWENAEAEGIDTGPAQLVGSIADIIAMFYGGAGAASGLGSAFGGGAASGAGTAGTGQLGWGSQVATQGGQSYGGLYGNAATGGVSSGAGGGSAFNWTDLMDAASNMGGNQNQQKQQAQAPTLQGYPTVNTGSIISGSNPQLSFKDWGQV